jgi:hypothetical protein
MMAARKPISKKMRFEVFKRDSFTCQYCGCSAPDAILEIDHIKPVCEGGKNSLLNLITSCRDCNRGKGKRELSDKQAVQKEKKQLDEINERRQQMEMLLKWKEELQKIAEKQIDAIGERLLDEDYQLTQKGRKQVASLIREFGFVEVYEASEIASYKYSWHQDRLDRLGGICYNRRKAKELGVKSYYGNQESS